jgi:hypothetical protein
LTNNPFYAIIQTDKRKGNKTMFEEMMNQMSDYSYEQALEQYWDCPEALLDDEWPDDLWDE